ncbi:MAG: hypothetical protein ACR2OW_07885, partial [Methyloligellaceae bacterium]
IVSEDLTDFPKSPDDLFESGIRKFPGFAIHLVVANCGQGWCNSWEILELATCIPLTLHRYC